MKLFCFQCCCNVSREGHQNWVSLGQWPCTVVTLGGADEAVNQWLISLQSSWPTDPNISQAIQGHTRPSGWSGQRMEAARPANSTAMAANHKRPSTTFCLSQCLFGLIISTFGYNDNCHIVCLYQFTAINTFPSLCHMFCKYFVAKYAASDLFIRYWCLGAITIKSTNPMLLWPLEWEVDKSDHIEI